MDKQALQNDVHALYQQADGGADLAALLDGVCTALRAHPDALRDVTASYRLRATDTGLERAFALDGGRYRDLAPSEAADATLLGAESDLLRVFRRELSPMKALLLRKVRLEGSKAAVMRLGEFL